MAFKKWNIAEADKEKASAISEKFNIDPFVAYLLAARGKVSEIAVSEFLSDEIRLSDPFDLLDMERAVERIEKAVESGEKITVYGDYDCDGVTSTVLLYSFLRDMGANVDFYIPSCKLVIELDGAQHTEPQAAEYDAHRTAYLQSIAAACCAMATMNWIEISQESARIFCKR